MAISMTPTSSSSSSSSSFGIFGTQSYRSHLGLGLDLAFPSSKRRACTPGGSIPSSYCPSCIIRMGPAPPGQIQRLVLSKEGRMKLNRYPDRDFYSFPRYVKHVDDTFLATLTEVYRERIREGAEVLDLMSSWVSHLPEDVKYKRVVGQGLNAGELARNPRLDKFFVRDLNSSDGKDGLRWLEEEMEAASFDAVVCTVSVQYLEEPEKVFAGIWRVLRPGGVCIVSFSNRMFYEKAVAAWRDGTAYSRTQLVQQYFQCVSGFTQPEVIRRPSPITLKDTKSPFQWLAQLFQAPISDPFYAVIAHKNFKPILEDSSNMPPTN